MGNFSDDGKSIQEILALVEAQASSKKGLNLEDRLKEDKLDDNKAQRGARKWFQSCLLALLSFEIFFIAYWRCCKNHPSLRGAFFATPSLRGAFFSTKQPRL